jgi:hypothetical protein
MLRGLCLLMLVVCVFAVGCNSTKDPGVTNQSLRTRMPKPTE